MERASQVSAADGGCDFRYGASPCVWGREPDRTAVALGDLLALPGAAVLDAGCGEGRNAVYLAGRGATVDAVDVSAAALANGPAAGQPVAGVRWQHADVRTVAPPARLYDAVLACSMLHWLADEAAIAAVLDHLRGVVRPGGLHALVVFNDRLPYPEAEAPRLPTLRPHQWYLDQYPRWQIVAATDADSTHTHAGGSAPHSHSITRIIARRPAGATDGTGGEQRDGQPGTAQ